MIARPAPGLRRRGTIVPLLALTTVLLFAFIALAVDVGVLTIARTEAQNGCDSAALAGARVLNNRSTSVNNDSTNATTYATNMATSNINVFVQQNKLYTVAENMTFTDGTQAVTIGQYNYSSASQTFTPTFPGTNGGYSWTAVRVQLQGNNPTFFAKVLGINSMPWRTYAIAAHRPRDVSIILDFSGSMQFGSQFSWETAYGGSNGAIYGLLSADPIYPQFGHFQRYTQYSRTQALTAANATSGTVGSRTNPFSTTRSFTMASGEVCANSNITVETSSGPPMILDFRFDPANINNPATPVTVPNPGNFHNAFNRWMQTTPAVENIFNDPSFRPAVTSVFDNGVSVDRTFNWSGYNAFDKTNQFGPTPAPDSFATQSNADATYAGDRYPRKGGQRFTDATTWDPATATGAARNVREMLSPATAGNTTLINPATRVIPPTITPVAYVFPLPNGDGGTTWNNFRDDLWERYGYDLNVSRYSGTAPVSTNRTQAEVRNTETFQGFSMGPAYYGKSFFIWPPDPRYNAAANPNAPNVSNTALATDTNNRIMADWRRRFFLKSDGTPFDPQGDNDPVTAGTQNINQTLLNTATGQTLNTGNRFRINYSAVLAWLKSGPMTLPPNLRAGRILYYSSIPDDVVDTANFDKRFWKDYIDYVLGFTGNDTGFDPTNALAGEENRAWPEGGAVSISSTAAQGTNPLPYMSYTDVPSMPRLHFWFGPLTMMNFLSARSASAGRNYWTAGTVHEAQMWQLKAGMNSALDDIKNNHPNDFCSLVYFSNYLFNTPRVPMGQDFATLKNALFYPSSLLPAIKTGNTTSEIRPYNIGMGNSQTGNIPNANGGTDPVSGFAMAFNTMSWSTSAQAARTPNGTVNGGTGRRNASKIVIYETDGVPNGRPAWTYQNAGTPNAYWREGGSNPGADAASDSIAVVNRMMLQQSAGGMSLPNAPCRVHALAFGDLFNITPITTQAQAGLDYLLDVQQAGGTSSAAETAFPTGKIITGTYQNRIANLKSALSTIMQSGVQVTLVE